MRICILTSPKPNGQNLSELLEFCNLNLLSAMDASITLVLVVLHRATPSLKQSGHDGGLCTIVAAAILFATVIRTGKARLEDG